MKQGVKQILWGCAASCLLLTASLHSAQAGTIKVGAIFAVTGPASFLGGPEARSAEMVVEKINKAGGINGDTLELIIKDSAGSSEKAVSFAKQLIEEEKVVAIIGPSTSGESMAVKKIAADNPEEALSEEGAGKSQEPQRRFRRGKSANRPSVPVWVVIM